MHQIDDCVGEYHGKKTVVHLVAVIKYTDCDTAYSKKEIGLLFGEADVVMKKTAVTYHDWVGCKRRRMRKSCEKKNR
jgi:hypothetical protein